MNNRNPDNLAAAARQPSSSVLRPLSPGRRGSVMIMVVALLVLLAIMGTAYLATSRGDRITSIQSQANQQTEHHVNGIIARLQDILAEDLVARIDTPALLTPQRPDQHQSPRYFDPALLPLPPAVAPLAFSDFRAVGPHPVLGEFYAPNQYILGTTGFENFDTPARMMVPLIDATKPQELKTIDTVEIDPDPWLADRLPEFRPGHRITSRSASEDDADPPFNRYVWRWLSAPITGIRQTVTLPDNSVDTNYWQFDNPYGTSFAAPRKNVFPDIAANGGPGLTWEVDPGNSMVLVDPPVPAADTDGDGIADALLAKLDGSATNGLTTYVGIRVIDNAAAVNAAIAWEHNRDDAATPGNFFPTNIGLASALAPSDSRANPRSALISNNDLVALRAFRSGGNGNINLRAVGDDGGTVRTDFEFRDVYDAMWHQLGRRPGLPGYNFPGTPYQRLPASDTLALAHGFVVGTPGITGGSTLERILTDASGLMGRVEPVLWRSYTPADVNDITNLWGDNNFADRLTAHDSAVAYESGASRPFFSARPLLVTYNPVSQAAPIHFSRPWDDQWGHVHRVPFHPSRRNGKDVAEMPDMLDYDLASRYKGNWVAGTYLPGDIVRDGDRTYICVKDTSINSGQGLAPSQLNLNNSNAARVAEWWEYQPYTPIPMKASLNTATFRELYRAFWNVMCDEQDPDRHPLMSPPFYEKINNQTAPQWGNHSFSDRERDGMMSWNNYKAEHYGQMFRSSIRDHTGGDANVRLNGKNQALLRAALAAVNTIDLRDSDDDVTSRTITLEAEPKTGSPVPVQVTVYGNEMQPFITRVYLKTFADNYASGGYALIELFNPHETDIDISGWKIITFDRNSGKRTPSPHYSLKRDATPITIGSNTIVPARGHAYLSNGTSGARPQDVTVDPLIAQSFSRYFYTISTLTPSNLFEKEFVIVRPRIYRQAAGTASSSNLSYDDYDESEETDWVPVDQHDASRVDDEPPATDPNAPDGEVVYYYRREHNRTNDRWKCVYPGAYDGNVSERYPVQNRDVDYAAKGQEPVLGIPVVLGSAVGGGSADSPFPPIQLNNTDFGGPNKTSASATPPYKFPFGGFARVGDVLQVPYIGAYKIKALATTTADEVIEFNSISMDSAFVSDLDTSNNAREHLGRFCPPSRPYASGSPPAVEWTYYDWAKDIFDHFTVIAPYDDYFPNIVGAPPIANKPANYPGFNTGGNAMPYHVATKYEPNTTTDDQPAETAVEGLININTAPLRVLATVPWAADSEGGFTRNLSIARAIVRHRQLTKDFDDGKRPGLHVKGPFRSLMDLQQMRIAKPDPSDAIKEGYFHELPSKENSAEPGDSRGDFSPLGAGNLDGTRNDFEEHYLMLTRVSNLITTRSDSFTAYICLQQWENAGTPDARMVSQRRYAVLLDRSGIVRDKKDVKVSYIPIDGN